MSADSLSLTISTFSSLFSLCILLRWGAMDAEAYSGTSKNLIQTLWSIGTYKKNNADPLWIKARGTAFHSLSHYKVMLHFVVLLSAVLHMCYLLIGNYISCVCTLLWIFLTIVLFSGLTYSRCYS